MRTGSRSSRHWVGFLREEQWTAPGTVDISSLWKSLELRGLQFRSIGIHKPAEHQQSCNLRKSMFMARPLGSAVVNHAMADAKSWLLGFHPRASGLTGLRAPLALVISIDGRNSGCLSPAHWSVVILSVHISVGRCGRWVDNTGLVTWWLAIEEGTRA